MSVFSAVLFLSLLFCVAAQTSSNGGDALQIEAIEAHFKQARLVPSLLPTFNPSALLKVQYSSVGVIEPGQALTKQQTALEPTIMLTPANSSVEFKGDYTIMMVDADVVGSDPSKGVNRHWLVNGLQVSGTALNNSSATTITAYAGPGPATGSGPHRYVILLYVQPANFTPPQDLSKPIGVTVFDLNGYAKESGLGPLFAANYLTVEDGTATMSVPATSAVVSSTLTVVSTTESSETAKATSTQSKNGSTGLGTSVWAAWAAMLVELYFACV